MEVPQAGLESSLVALDKAHKAVPRARIPPKIKLEKIKGNYKEISDRSRDSKRRLRMRFQKPRKKLCRSRREETMEVPFKLLRRQKLLRKSWQSLMDNIFSLNSKRWWQRALNMTPKSIRA